MQRSRFTAALIGTTLAFAVALPLAAWAAKHQTKAASQADANSLVVAIVNDVPITEMDVRHRAALLRAARAGKLSALDDLISDILKVQEAALKGVHPSEEDVDAAIKAIAGGSKISPAQLASNLDRLGAGIETFRKRIGAQQAFAQIVRARMQTNIVKSAQDDNAAAFSSGNVKEKIVNDYSLRRIVFTVSGQNAAQYSSRLAQAQALRKQFTSCETGPDLAKAAGAVVVPIGHRLHSDLGPKEIAVLEATPVGGLTPPDKTPLGVEMIAVCSKEPHKIRVAAEVKSLTDDQLNAQGEQIAETLLREARQRAIIVYPNKK